MGNSKTMTLPEEVVKIFDDFMRSNDDFLFNNMTDFLIFGGLRFIEDFEEANKSKEETDKIIREIIKLCKQSIKEGLIKDKMYGWKKQYREVVQK